MHCYIEKPVVILHQTINILMALHNKEGADSKAMERVLGIWDILCTTKEEYRSMHPDGDDDDPLPLKVEQNITLSAFTGASKKVLIALKSVGPSPRSISSSARSYPPSISQSKYEDL